jgi:hypothetical protein
MLGFAPIAAATLGGSGVVREVVPAGITGVQSSVTLGAISLSTNALISDQAERKPETVEFYDPNNDGIGVVRRLELGLYFWDRAFILGMRPQIPSNQENGDSATSGPIWDEAVAGDKALSIQTKTTSELTSDPVVSQSSWVPLVNGDYTYPATYDSSLGYDAVAKPVTVNLNHLPSETIVSNAATISTIDDPLLATLTFPASDPTLFNVIIGQVRSINTYDPTDTDTYFNSLITGQVGEIQWPNENKHYLLQKYDSDKGFLVGTVQRNSFGTDKTTDGRGAAWVSYGFRLQPQITAANFPDGTPVSQEHTLLVTSSLGTIQANISKELSGVEGTLSSNLGITPAITSFVAGFDIGTVGLPDPQWYLSTSRVELVAEPNQPANDVIYPYASRSPTAGPAQTDFDFTVSLGALDAPIAVDQPVGGLGLTVSLGTPTLRSFNTLTVDSQLVTLSENLTGIEPQTTEIISSADSILISASLGSVVTLATSNATCTTRLATLGLGNVTFAANANTAPSGLEFTSSVGNITFTGDANTFPSGLELVASVGIAGIPAITAVTTAGFVTVTLGMVGVGAGKLVSGFLVDVELGTPTATGIHFDFEAIKHLYNTKRSQHAGFPANRTVRPAFSTPRQVKPLKSTQNLAA